MTIPRRALPPLITLVALLSASCNSSSDSSNAGNANVVTNDNGANNNSGGPTDNGTGNPVPPTPPPPPPPPALSGAFDTSFGTGGIATASSAFNGAFATRTSVLPGSDGSVGLGANLPAGLETASFDASGAPAASLQLPTCGTLFGAAACVPSRLLTLSDGKLVVGFLVTSTTGSAAFVRFAANGTLDTTFGTGGITTIPGLTIQSGPDAVLELSDRSLLAAVQTSSLEIVVIKLGASGSLDPAFGIGGMTTLSGIDSGAGLAVNPTTHEIYSGGFNSTSTNAVVVRLSSAGIQDSAFGASGVATIGSQGGSTINVETGYDAIHDRIVALEKVDAGTQSVYVAQLLPDGTPDPAFGTSGLMHAAIAAGAEVYGSNQLLIEDTVGKILVLGNHFGLGATTGPTSSFDVIRITTTGALDSGFGTNGVLSGPAGAFYSASSMAFDAHHDLFLAGEAVSFASYCIFPVPGGCFPGMTQFQPSADHGLVAKIK